MKEISYEESLELTDPLYIDVRSPDEFSHDHIPGAINMPIFDNEERSKIGTIYKITGKENAIIKGTEIVSEKIGSIVSDIFQYKDKNIVFVCSRGGMRSRSVAALVSSLGLRVFKLKQGYKEYRRYILERLESIKVKPQLFVLQGLTGSGKTEIIQEIDNSIDLERMAGHRSSLFGGIGLKQNSQKRFESLLNSRIKELENKKYTVIEGESRKIGNLHIPPSLFQQMKNSPVILINTPLDRRIDIIIKEYTKHADSDKIPDIVRSLRSKLGLNKVNTLLELFYKGNLREFTSVLLEKYYDPLYKHSLDNMKFIDLIENKDTGNTIQLIKECITEYLQT